jgi:hypothetical protein
MIYNNIYKQEDMQTFSLDTAFQDLQSKTSDRASVVILCKLHSNSRTMRRGILEIFHQLKGN